MNKPRTKVVRTLSFRASCRAVVLVPGSCLVSFKKPVIMRPKVTRPPRPRVVKRWRYSLLEVAKLTAQRLVWFKLMGLNLVNWLIKLLGPAPNKTFDFKVSIAIDQPASFGRRVTASC